MLRGQLEPANGRLGDVLTLRIEAQHAPGERIEPPAPTKTLGSFEVLASTQGALPPSGASETQVFLYQLQNFTTGQQLLPPLTFTHYVGGRAAGQLKTQELKVQIEKVPPGPNDKGDIRGIKGVIGPVAISPLWWWLLAFALLITGICLWKERQRKLAGPPPEPPTPPDQSALDKLQDLLASGWIEAGKMKEFYSGISDIVRGYIETRFKCPALERTTGELMRDLRQRDRVTSGNLVELKSLLEECDLVKFAKYRPDSTEALKAHAIAVRFVEQTAIRRAGESRHPELDSGFRRGDN